MKALIKLTNKATSEKTSFILEFQFVASNTKYERKIRKGLEAYFGRFENLANLDVTDLNNVKVEEIFVGGNISSEDGNHHKFSNYMVEVVGLPFETININ